MRSSRPGIWAFWIGASLAALAGVSVLALGTGPSWLPPGEVVRALLGGGEGPSAAIVNDIRLPRIALGALVGCALGISGAAMQGVFRNPMADPYIIGISPGAALGAVVAVASGVSVSVLGLSAISLAAFAGALLAALTVMTLARRGSLFPVADLLLVGIAVGAFASAVYSLLALTLADSRIAAVFYWLLGSLSAADWDRVLATLPYLAVVAAVLLSMARQLDVFALGEEEAGYLGIRVERMKLIVVGAASLGAAAAVAVSGVIGFVGLIVPHLARLVVGPRHALLLPVSGIWGATLLVAADAVARSALAYSEIPVGIITALCGAPFFLYLLKRTRKRGL
ncbi:iron ABC transporter permease [Rubrobacter taiwanensis]|jgi:iron complex transport system permease protein|uniref:Iron ABC transporter permease n=1 Tax=Rubrobacter taiwanensis TaxID=185139 RepID=A0A4R1BLS9_9ACTN|nr:iron ABC transporter permease [Rubrobacter taiwanensis]TCJ18287.1 iron ABC transporter permease [Rubrobacter taiwanensis]